MKTPKGKARELTPEGNQPATLVGVIDYGTQESNNPDFEATRRLNTAWEVLDKRTEKGDPFVVYKEYTFSSNAKSTLAKDFKAWGMDPDDVEVALGKTALVNVVHKETASGTFANIATIAPVPKGMKHGKHKQPLVALFLDPEEFDQEVFDGLPEWQRNKIAASPEYADCIAAANGKKKKAPVKTATKAAPAKKK